MGRGVDKWIGIDPKTDSPVQAGLCWAVDVELCGLASGQFGLGVEAEGGYTDQRTALGNPICD